MLGLGRGKWAVSQKHISIRLYQEYLLMPPCLFLNLLLLNLIFLQARNIEKRKKKSDVVFMEIKKRILEMGLSFHFKARKEKRKTKIHSNFIFSWNLKSVGTNVHGLVFVLCNKTHNRNNKEYRKYRYT